MPHLPNSCCIHQAMRLSLQISGFTCPVLFHLPLTCLLWGLAKSLAAPWICHPDSSCQFYSPAYSDDVPIILLLELSTRSLPLPSPAWSLWLHSSPLISVILQLFICWWLWAVLQFGGYPLLLFNCTHVLMVLIFVRDWEWPFILLLPPRPGLTVFKNTFLHYCLYVLLLRTFLLESHRYPIRIE